MYTKIDKSTFKIHKNTLFWSTSFIAPAVISRILIWIFLQNFEMKLVYKNHMYNEIKCTNKSGHMWMQIILCYFSFIFQSMSFQILDSSMGAK